MNEKKGIDGTLKEIIKVVRYENIQRDYDTVYAIVGGEGTGKTNLGLHIITEYKQDVTIDSVGLDIPDFITALYTSGQGDPVDFDEAGDGLNSRDGMSFLNKDLIKAYMVCRGKNLFTVLVLPDFFMLDTYFRKHRVKALLWITERGKYNFYDKEKIKVIIDKGEKTKNINVIPPLYKGWFSKYEGPLLEAYLKKKSNKIKSTMDNLYFTYVSDKKLTQRQACKILNVGFATLKGYIDSEQLPCEINPNGRIYIKEADLVKLKAKLLLLAKKRKEEWEVRKKIKKIAEGGNIG